MPPSISNRWTKERIERACELWDAGLTAREIAAALGVSRNAIIGLAHRQGFVAKAKVGQARAKYGSMVGRPRQHMAKAQARQLKPKPRVLPKVLPPREKPVRLERPRPLPAPAAIPTPILELTASSCRWPLWDAGPPYLFCGHPRLEPQVYCAVHCRVAYRGYRDEEPERRAA
jgi:GcrA cell cycle regulator